MSNISVSIIIKKQYEEIISSFFITKCLNSVVINDPSMLPDKIYSVMPEKYADIPDGYVKVTSSFPEYKKNIKKQIIDFLEKLNIEHKIFFIKLPDKDWNNEWKSFFKGVEIKGFINVLPPWLSQQKKDPPVAIINPGRGFGTGDHATSKLCLRALKNIKLKNKNIADLGCGSGILGICCKILGASKVLMLEHDKQAVENAKDNIDLNGLGNSNIFVKEFDVMKNHVDNINDYHIIICNIWPHVNEKVAELNYKKIKKNAQILFTGVFRTDHENFSSFLKKQGYNIINIDILDDWYLYITEKN